MAESPSPGEILDELAEARDRWWLFSLVFNLLAVAGLGGAMLLLLALADWQWHYSTLVLQAIWLVGCGVSLGLLVLTLVMSAARHRSLAATARRLEISFPELGSDLINLVQLSDQGERADTFTHAAIRDATRRVADFPIQAAPYRYGFCSRWRLAMQTGNDVFGLVSGLLGILTLSIVLYFLLPNWSRSVDRALRPWQAEETPAD